MTSRMHPGWKAFFCAWFSGLLTMIALSVAAATAGRGAPVPWGYVIVVVGLASILFGIGGRVAERLTDRIYYFKVMDNQDEFRDLIAREIWNYQELTDQFGLAFDQVNGGGGLAADLAKRMCIDEAELIRIAIITSPMKGLLC